MQRVALEFAPRGGFAVLRGLCGHDEEAVGGTDTEAALGLLDRLLVDAPGVIIGPGHAAELAAPDRDRLLATVFRDSFGPRVESTVACAACHEPFDLDFVVGELVADLAAAAREGTARTIVRDAGSIFRLPKPDGRGFRLPTGADELAIFGLPPGEAEREMLRRCVVDGAPGDDPNAVLEAMRAVGPLVDLDLDAQCPACGHQQQVHFDLQHYLLNLIVQEGRQRIVEIHRLARTYGWSLGEILGLPRQRRRALVDQIDRETPA